METKQTAVKFLWQWIMKNPLGSFDDGIKAYNKAKQMEKEQIEEAFNSGIGYDGLIDDCNSIFNDYYNETYGN
jgi:hypothetical protein